MALRRGASRNATVRMRFGLQTSATRNGGPGSLPKDAAAARHFRLRGSAGLPRSRPQWLVATQHHVYSRFDRLHFVLDRTTHDREFDWSRCNANHLGFIRRILVASDRTWASSLVALPVSVVGVHCIGYVGVWGPLDNQRKPLGLRRGTHCSGGHPRDLGDPTFTLVLLRILSWPLDRLIADANPNEQGWIFVLLMEAENENVHWFVCHAGDALRLWQIALYREESHSSVGAPFCDQTHICLE